MEMHERVAGVVRVRHDNGYVLLTATEPELPNNVVVPANVVRQWPGQILPGMQIEVGSVMMDRRGYVALRILSAASPDTMQWVPVVGRWVNKPRGYAFVTAGDGSPDVFVHAVTLSRADIPLDPETFIGQAFEVVIYVNGRGLAANAIRKPQVAKA